MPAEPTDRLPPPATAQLGAWVAEATPQDQVRALRLVLGAEQAWWARDLRSGETWCSPTFLCALGLPEVDRDAINGRIHPVARLTPRDPASLAGAAAPEPPERRPSAAAGRAGSGHVLIVEDNPVNLMIAEEFVRQIGFDTARADDGAAALAACAERVPRLVLMDLQMPGMDGIEATRRLRAWQAEGTLPPFPIIALSAHAGDADRLQALAAGADDYLTKPILLEALRAALARHLPELR